MTSTGIARAGRMDSYSESTPWCPTEPISLASNTSIPFSEKVLAESKSNSLISPIYFIIFILSLQRDKFSFWPE